VSDSRVVSKITNPIANARSIPPYMHTFMTKAA